MRGACPGLAPAIDSLKDGGLALVPTETVYGVGVAVAAFESLKGIPGPETGYGRIFTLKRRELSQTVPWLVDGPEALDRYGRDVPVQVRVLAEKLWPGALTLVVPASDRVPPFMRADDGTVALRDRYGRDVPVQVRVLAEKLWPGALTLVVPASDRVPPFMRADDGTVALRASASPVIRELVARCGSPLAVTSANTHGAPAPTSFGEVEPRILEGVDIAIDAGQTPCRDSSTIVAIRDGEPAILRQGALGAAEIYAALA